MTHKVEELALLEAHMKAEQASQIAIASRKKMSSNSEATTEEAAKKGPAKRKAKPKSTEKVRIFPTLLFKWRSYHSTKTADFLRRMKLCGSVKPLRATLRNLKSQAKRPTITNHRRENQQQCQSQKARPMLKATT